MATNLDTGHLYLEDLYEGRNWSSSSRTVTESDVVNFAGITGDYFPLHTSEVYARDSAFKERIAHGLLGLTYAHGLMWTRTGALDQSVIAFLGIRGWKFIAPVYFGDTIHVEYRVIENTPSAGKSDHGRVMFQVDVTNQRDEVVQSGQKEMLIKARGSRKDNS